MLFALVQSNISAYPHKAVTMQFFEAASRYADFFKVRKECIMPTLQAMVDARCVTSYPLPFYVSLSGGFDHRGLHSSDSAVRSRVSYLFCRFIRESRNDVAPDLAQTLLEGIRDLLEPAVELPELDDPETQDLLSEALAHPGAFDAQLYLFETAGVLLALCFKRPDEQAALLLSVVRPLLDRLQQALQTPVKGPQDVLPVLTVHHVVMALGNVAKGFPDYPSPLPAGYIMPPLAVFQQVASAILVSLEAMNVFKAVRDAVSSVWAVSQPSVVD